MKHRLLNQPQCCQRMKAKRINMIIDEMQHSGEENWVNKAARTVDQLEYCITEILNMRTNIGVACGLGVWWG